MEFEQILHMNGGEGEYSYANNSPQQREAILKAKPLLEQSLFDLYGNGGFPDCIRFADMGCSSGPNSLLPTWEAIDSLEKICNRMTCSKPPVLQAFLNDLPGTDFNTIFKTLPSFYQRLRTEKGGHEFIGSCFIAAVPGSFYRRLFPSNFLHFVYSSYGLHWLSQAPKGLVSEHDIHKAYLDQFESDMSAFLKFRSEELKPEGRMVLAFLFNDNYNPTALEPIMMVIKDMVSEGLIEESKMDSFKFPIYAPSIEEAKQVIQREGSFAIHQLETFHVSWLVGFDENDNKGLEDKYSKGKHVAGHARAAAESLLSNHFGDAIIEEIFHRYPIKVTHEFLERGRGAIPTQLISLVKK